MADPRPRVERPTCETIVGWCKCGEPHFCGTVARWRYPAMGGGFMHLCDEHGIKHLNYAEAIGMTEARDG